MYKCWVLIYFCFVSDSVLRFKALFLFFVLNSFFDVLEMELFRNNKMVTVVGRKAEVLVYLAHLSPHLRPQPSILPCPSTKVLSSSAALLLGSTYDS